MSREVLQNILIAVFGLALLLVGYAVFAQYQALNDLGGRIDSMSQMMMESSEKMDDAMMKMEEMQNEMEEDRMKMEEQAMMEESAVRDWQRDRCLSSGGAFNQSCVCPDDYTLSDAYCIDAFGLPGGELGPSIQQDQANVMARTSCTDSGGSYQDNQCACPSEYELDVAGYCIDAFGLPGGSMGEQIKQKHEARMNSE